MKIVSFARHGHRLTRFGFVNCYLVAEEDGFTLIDGGILASSAEMILAAAARLGAPIRRILLTHAHSDHVGAIDALMTALGSGVDLACSARTVPLLASPPDGALRPGEPPGKVTNGPGIASRPTRLLAEGELCGSLRVVETPGHAPGHLSFFDERDGTLYAGDALVAMGRLAVPGYAPWYFFLPNVATWNRDVALASAQRLGSLPIARFACGHGPVRDGGSDMLAAAIAGARS